MATVRLNWRDSDSSTDRGVYRCEIRSRNDEDALVLEVHDRGWAVFKDFSVTVYYWVAGRERGIPLCDDEGFDRLDDAKAALTQWYLENAPTLLVTLAG